MLNLKKIDDIQIKKNKKKRFVYLFFKNDNKKNRTKSNSIIKR